jgi:hypothetical protein
MRPQGRVLLIAGRQRVSSTFNLGLGCAITIKQHSHFDRDDVESLIRLVARGSVANGPLVIDVVPVPEADRLYTRLRDEPARRMAASSSDDATGAPLRTHESAMSSVRPRCARKSADLPIAWGVTFSAAAPRLGTRVRYASSP